MNKISKCEYIKVFNIYDIVIKFDDSISVTNKDIMIVIEYHLSNIFSDLYNEYVNNKTIDKNDYKRFLEDHIFKKIDKLIVFIGDTDYILINGGEYMSLLTTNLINVMF
jgi:hypothetical protein